MPLQDSRRVARGLNRAALTMDARGVAQLLQRQIAVAGVVSTWEDVMVPVLESIGRRWETTGEGVEIEHLFAEAAIASLTAVAGRLDQPRNTGAGAAQLRRGGAAQPAGARPGRRRWPNAASPAASSGRAVPTDALAAAVRRTGPAVTLGLRLDARARPHPRAACCGGPGRNAQLILGGPGWGTPTLPPYAEMVDSLGAAVRRICDIVAA